MNSCGDRRGSEWSRIGVSLPDPCASGFLTRRSRSAQRPTLVTPRRIRLRSDRSFSHKKTQKAQKQTPRTIVFPIFAPPAPSCGQPLRSNGRFHAEEQRPQRLGQKPIPLRALRASVRTFQSAPGSMPQPQRPPRLYVKQSESPLILSSVEVGRRKARQSPIISPTQPRPERTSERVIRRGQ